MEYICWGHSSDFVLASSRFEISHVCRKTSRTQKLRKLLNNKIRVQNSMVLIEMCDVGTDTLNGVLKLLDLVNGILTLFLPARTSIIHLSSSSHLSRVQLLRGGGVRGVREEQKQKMDGFLIDGCPVCVCLLCVWEVGHICETGRFESEESAFARERFEPVANARRARKRLLTPFTLPALRHTPLRSHRPSLCPHLCVSVRVCGCVGLTWFPSWASWGACPSCPRARRPTPCRAAAGCCSPQPSPRPSRTPPTS